MLKTIGERFIIDPYYEGRDTKIGSIIIPDSMADSQPSQGMVVVAPENLKELEGKYVTFHRFREQAWVKGMLVLEEKDLVCELTADGDLQLFAHREELLILPDWESKYRQPSSLIYLPPVALEHNQPVMFGWIVLPKFGFIAGERVAIEPFKGSEIAIRNTLYYIIPLEHILAKCYG